MSGIFLTGLGLLGVCSYFLLTGLRSGEIWAAKVPLKLDRRKQPVLFWFTAGVYLILACVGLLFVINPLGL